MNATPGQNRVGHQHNAVEVSGHETVTLSLKFSIQNVADFVNWTGCGPPVDPANFNLCEGHRWHRSDKPVTGPLVDHKYAVLLRARKTKQLMLLRAVSPGTQIRSKTMSASHDPHWQLKHDIFTDSVTLRSRPIYQAQLPEKWTGDIC